MNCELHPSYHSRRLRMHSRGRQKFPRARGDPGVATYYNGIFSPDFGIASTENGLYDLKRVEVLRGPQGTLYGETQSVAHSTMSPTIQPTNRRRIGFNSVLMARLRCMESCQAVSSMTCFLRALLEQNASAALGKMA